MAFFVFLLNGQAGFRDRFFTGVDASDQSDDAVLLGEIQGHLETGDGSPVRVYLQYFGILKLPDHVIINVLGRTVEIFELLLDYHVVAILVDMVLVYAIQAIHYLFLGWTVASRGTHHVPAHLLLLKGC